MVQHMEPKNSKYKEKKKTKNIGYEEIVQLIAYGLMDVFLDSVSCFILESAD